MGAGVTETVGAQDVWETVTEPLTARLGPRCHWQQQRVG